MALGGKSTALSIIDVNRTYNCCILRMAHRLKSEKKTHNPNNYLFDLNKSLYSCRIQVSYSSFFHSFRFSENEMSQNGENNRLQIMWMTDKKYISFFFRNNQEERIKKLQMKIRNKCLCDWMTTILNCNII